MQVIFLLLNILVAALPTTPVGRVIQQGPQVADITHVVPLQGAYAIITRNNEIRLITKEGEIFQRSGGFGSGNESFSQISDVTVFRDLQLHIVDEDRSRVSTFDAQLNLIGTFSSDPEAEETAFNRPLGLRLAQTGEWFLLDGFDQKIIKYNLRGKAESVYTYPLGGEQDYWQDLRFIEIDTQKRRIFVYDGFFATLYSLDYWGNQLEVFSGIEELEKLVPVNDAYLGFARGRFIALGSKDMALARELNVQLERLAAPVRTVFADRDGRSLLVLMQEALLRVEI
jgi:hypothetical protein